MKQITVMKWLLDVDVEQTKEFYRKEIELCDCLYCQNYMEMCKHFDSSVLEILHTLGINPSKPSHLSEFGEMEDGLRLYIGSYHLVGKVAEGEYCADSDWNAANTARIDNFTFGFGKEVMFLHDAFPHPALQLEFEARIPWGLHEKLED